MYKRARTWVASHQGVVVVGAGVALIALGLVVALALVAGGDGDGEEVAAEREPVDFTSGLGEADDGSRNRSTSGSRSGATSTSPSSASGTSETAASASTNSGGAGRSGASTSSTGPVRLEVSTDAGWYLVGAQPTSVSIAACNDADHGISQTTPSARLYEIDVVNSSGDVVADDSDSVFADGLTQTGWAAGECKTISDSWVHTRGPMHTARADRYDTPLAPLGDYAIRVRWIADSAGAAESAAFGLRHAPPGAASFADFEITATATLAGGDVEIRLGACNRADFARVNHFKRSADFEVFVVDAADDVVADLRMVEPDAVVHRYANINPGKCRKHGFVWDSGGVDPGKYRLRVKYLGIETGALFGEVFSAPFSLA